MAMKKYTKPEVIKIDTQLNHMVAASNPNVFNEPADDGSIYVREDYSGDFEWDCF